MSAVLSKAGSPNSLARVTYARYRRSRRALLLANCITGR